MLKGMQSKQMGRRGQVREDIQERTPPKKKKSSSFLLQDHGNLNHGVRIYQSGASLVTIKTHPWLPKEDLSSNEARGSPQAHGFLPTCVVPY